MVLLAHVDRPYASARPEVKDMGFGRQRHFPKASSCLGDQMVEDV